MSGPEPAAGREIAPKDVFARSNMPSRWERLTNVSPKTAPDRMYLAFVAARFRGDELLPHPDDVEPPEAFGTRRAAGYVCWAAAALASILFIIGLTAHLPAAAVAAVAMLVAVLMGAAIIAMATQPAITEFNALRAECVREESRLHGDSLDPENTSTLNAMINHDEGTLAYCAAKIASEIDQDPAWHSTHIDIVPIDLWDELTDIGESARQISEDREATRAVEKGRLRDDPDVRTTIREDKQQRAEALALLAARVSAFADYRDHVHRVSISAGRDSKALSRTVRRVADQQAVQRLR